MRDFPTVQATMRAGADQIDQLQAMLARVVEAEFGWGEWPTEAEIRALISSESVPHVPTNAQTAEDDGPDEEDWTGSNLMGG
jgi:hypothetical protein